MQREDRDIEGQSKRVQKKKKRKPKVIYSSRKVIEASRMRQAKTRSRVAEIDPGFSKAINFAEDDIVGSASVNRSDTLLALNIGGGPSTESLICKTDEENRVSDYPTLLIAAY